MLRRKIRLTKEYLYRKSLEGKQRLLYEKKRKIKEALEEGKPIPTELRNEEAALRQEIDLEDENTAVPRSHIDDEYANASQRDPKILLTTSRDPSAPLIQFAKELKLVFPNAQQMNRGGQVISEIIETCRSHEFTDVVLVHEHRGVPDGLIISHLPFGPTAYFQLLNVVTRHDIKDKKAMGTMPQVYPHLILDNFTTKDYNAVYYCMKELFEKVEQDKPAASRSSSAETYLLGFKYKAPAKIDPRLLDVKHLFKSVEPQKKLGERAANILKHLFPVPKPDTKRIITFANRSDYISFRHHTYEKPGGPKSIELKEIGPRFELRLFKIRLGTMDQDEAQNEWVIRPYMNTAKKQKYMGD